MSPIPRRESNVDVLVIGAGPAGLMCANALIQAGVNVRIVDKRLLKVAAGQADGIQPRTIEVMQSYGLADRLLREANQMHMAAFYNPNKIGEIERTGRAPDVTASDARYPFEVTLHQGAIEAIFLDSMQSSGLSVERPITPTSLELSQNIADLHDSKSFPVKVALQHVDKMGVPLPEIELIHAKFVVGADGAHSWVRKSLDISMDGEQTDYIWGVVDMVPDTNFPDIRNRTAIHSNNGSCMIIPRENDTVRLYVQLSDTDMMDPTTGRVDKDRMSAEKILSVAQKSFHPFYIENSAPFYWWTVYIIGQRVASQFSVHERVFIVGDACHTHSPKAGQGMNASMNDSHNLAWKLAYVLRGWAGMSLLKTYEYERRAYAQDLINFDKEFSALFSGKPRTKDNQDGITHDQFLRAFQKFGGFTSGIGVCYRPSDIVCVKHQPCASKVIVGQRMPPHVFVRAADARPIELQDLLPSDTRFKILLFVGDINNSTQYGRIVRLAQKLDDSECFLKKYSTVGHRLSGFEMLTILSGQKDDVNYLLLPQMLRPHWTKVLIDDTDVTRTQGGGGYIRFGIDSYGSIMVVRPDGFVGMVAPLDTIDDVNSYFASFLYSSCTPLMSNL